MSSIQAFIPYKTAVPLDLKVYDDNEDAVIYITDAPLRAPQSLHLEISNTSSLPLSMKRLDDVSPSQDNYHYALYFRKGVLTNEDAVQLSPADKDWKISKPQYPTADKNVVAYYLLRVDSNTQNSLAQANGNQNNAQSWEIASHETTKLTLVNLTAAPGAGTRSTNLELRAGNHFYDDQSVIAEKEEIQITLKRNLKLINHRGRKHIPMHIDFVGSNSVLNNGRANKNPLILRIANTSHEQPLFFKHENSDESPSIVIWFEEGDNQESWALADPNQVSGIKIKDLSKDNQPSQDNQASHDNQASRNQWVIKEEDLPASLAPHDGSGKTFFDLPISNIITNYPTGLTNVYIRYKNIPGYWDGQMVCQIQKTPLVITDSRLGIGTESLSKPLSIRAQGLGEELLGFEDPSGTLKWHVNQNFGGNKPGINFAETGKEDGRLFLQAGGNVGIGTTDPEEKLEVNGNIKLTGDGKGIQLIDTIAEDRYVSKATISAENYTGLKIGFPSPSFGGKLTIGSWSTDAEPVFKELVRFKHDGSVGIGTTDPKSKLHLSSGKLQIGNTAIGEDELKILLKLAKSELNVAIASAAHGFYLDNYAYRHDDGDHDRTIQFRKIAEIDDATRMKLIISH